jgi:hypothetical protein
MLKDNRSVLARLAVAIALAVPVTGALAAPATADPRPEAFFPVALPAGQHYSFSDFDVDQNGFVYVLWKGLVQKYSPAGELLRTWGSYGSGPGQFLPPTFNLSTSGIAVDDLGHVLVTDFPGNRLVEFTADGDFVTNLGGLQHPSGVAVDADDNLLVNELMRFSKVAQDGTVLARRSGGFGGGEPGPGGRVYFLTSWALTDEIVWVEGPSLQSEGSFPVLFGNLPDPKGYTSPTCCGIAYREGRLWVGRSEIGDMEAYGPNGGLIVACPIPGRVDAIVAGRDGRLYVSTGDSIVRYADSTQPCDTEPPRIKDFSMSAAVRTSTSRRLRRGWMAIGVSKQSEATATFTRLVLGRKVKGGRCVRKTKRNRRHGRCVIRRVPAATYPGLPVPVNQGAYISFSELFARERLPLGLYRVTVVVRDRNGMVSSPRGGRVLLTR